jgi:hypothetical protein
MKITIEVNGYKIVVTEDMFEGFLFSLPRDVITTPDGKRELGHAHMMIGGRFKDDVYPEWVEA